MEGRIVWKNGPFKCGSYPDVRIFRLNMKSALLPGERVIADRGYGDERCSTPDTLTAEGRQLASEIRARHETVNGRFKKFRVLRDTFRHDRSKHSVCFHAVASITQLQMDSEPLFYVSF